MCQISSFLTAFISQGFYFLYAYALSSSLNVPIGKYAFDAGRYLCTILPVPPAGGKHILYDLY